MGIDIYLCDHKCDKDSEIDNACRQQRAYIRESYHGGTHYPSEQLLPESFNYYDVKVTYEQLKQRLPDTIKEAILRAQLTYNMDAIDEIQKLIEPYFDFVHEVAQIESEGKEAWVTNSY